MLSRQRTPPEGHRVDSNGKDSFDFELTAAVLAELLEKGRKGYFQTLQTRAPKSEIIRESNVAAVFED